MRKKVIAGNWKMNKNMQEAEQFMDEAVKSIQTTDNSEAIVCAPFLYLTKLVEKAKGSDVKIAAQTMHYAENGAFTGEVSPAMLQDVGVTHVIIGHRSEERRVGKECRSQGGSEHRSVRTV